MPSDDRLGEGVIWDRSVEVMERVVDGLRELEQSEAVR